MSVEILDLRPGSKPDGLVELGKAPRHWRRDVADVDRIVLHQGGDIFGLSRWARARVFARTSTVAEELAKRGRRMPYHVVCGVAEGKPWAAQVWPVDVYTYHGNRANRRSVGVGILGDFPRVESKWKPKHSPIDEAEAFAEATTAALRLAVGMLPSVSPHVRGPNVQALALTPPLVLAHRQLRDMRDRDPGELAIRGSVAPLVVERLIRVEPDYFENGGEPWPEEWRRHLPR